MNLGQWIVLVVTLVGLALWTLPDPAKLPKAIQVGAVMFSWGLLVFLLCICGVAQFAHTLFPK